MKNRINIAVSMICGLMFIPIEVTFRALSGSMVNDGFQYQALMGFSSLHMVWVAALTTFLMGRVADGSPRYTFTWFKKILKAAAIGTAVEFVTGIILNKWLGLNIWDYSNKPGNVMGQIAPEFAMYWFLLAPFALWLDDAVRASLNKVPKLRDYYLKSFFWWIK